MTGARALVARSDSRRTPGRTCPFLPQHGDVLYVHVMAAVLQLGKRDGD